MLRPATLRAATAAPRWAATTTTCRPSSLFTNTPMRYLTTQSTETTTPIWTPKSNGDTKNPVQSFLSQVELESDAALKSSAHRKGAVQSPLSKVKLPLVSSQTYARVHVPAGPRSPRVLTYLVERTKSGNLSIYNDVKSGGTRKYTIIQRIQGDRQDLKKDIITELKFKKDDVNVNPVTNHVAIKGHHEAAVKTWLQARGF